MLDTLDRLKLLSHRTLLRWATALLAAGLLGVPLTRAAEPQAKKPNVLFIAVDDLNHWVGYLGRNSQTMCAARGKSITPACIVLKSGMTG